jgi:hypothetical protein
MPKSKTENQLAAIKIVCDWPMLSGCPQRLAALQYLSIFLNAVKELLNAKSIK